MHSSNIYEYKLYEVIIIVSEDYYMYMVFMPRRQYIQGSPYFPCMRLPGNIMNDLVGIFF